MATNKKSTAKKTAAKKVAKPAPKKCATRTCKCKKKGEKNEKRKFIFFGLAVILIILCGSLGAMTWARYYTTAGGTSNVQVALWDVDITKDGSSIKGSTTQTITLTPTNSHTHVAQGKIAPGSQASATFAIDFGDTEVESEYTLTFTMPQTLAAQNAVLQVTSTVGSPTCSTNGNVTSCTGTIDIDPSTQKVATSIVNVTATLNWDSHDSYHAEDDDDDDTADGIAAGNMDITVSISARQAFRTNP